MANLIGDETVRNRAVLHLEELAAQATDDKVRLLYSDMADKVRQGKAVIRKVDEVPLYSWTIDKLKHPLPEGW